MSIVPVIGYLAAGLFGVGMLLSCSRPPETPPLPKSETRLGQILIGSTLTRQDVREIFDELNREKRFEFLKVWFEPASDQNLKVVLDWTNQFLLQDALTDSGLCRLLEHAVQNKDFTVVREQIDRWKGSRYGPAVARAIILLLGDRSSPTMAANDIHWLDPSLDPIWTKLQESSRQFHRKGQYEELSITPPTGIDWLSDLKSLSKTPGLDVWWDGFESRLADGQVLRALFNSQAELLGSGASEGLVYTLRRLLSRAPERPNHVGEGAQNQIIEGTNLLEQLVRFGSETNSLTQGLFTVMGQGLRENPDILKKFSDRLIEKFSGLVASSMRAIIVSDLRNSELSLTREDWLAFPRGNAAAAQPNFVRVFSAVQQAFNRIIGGEDRFERIIVPYAVTRRIESLLQANLHRLPKEEVSFQKTLWDQPLEVASRGIDLVVEKEGKTSSPYANDFKQFKLEPLLEDMLNRYSSRFDTRFQFEFPEGQQTLGDAIESTLLSILETRRLDQNHSLMRAIAVAMVDPKLGFPVTVQGFDSPSLFSTLNVLMGNLTIDKIRTLKRFLFEELRLGNLPASEIGLLSELFSEHPILQRKLVSILESIIALNEFDIEPADGIPTGFESFVTMVKHLSPKAQPQLGFFFEFTHAAKLFGLNRGNPDIRNTYPFEPRYPGTYRWLLAQPDQIASTLETLAQLSFWEQQTLLINLQKTLDGSKPRQLRDHWRLVDRLRQEQPGAWVGLFDEGATFWPSSGITPIYRRWLTRAIPTQQTLEVWEAVADHWPSQSWADLAKEFRVLLKDGTFDQALDALALINDARIQRWITVLESASQSGQLQEFFASISGFIELSRGPKPPLPRQPRPSPILFTNTPTAQNP